MTMSNVIRLNESELRSMIGDVLTEAKSDPASSLKIKIKLLKKLIREEISPRPKRKPKPTGYAACVFDVESEEWRFFAKGSKEECTSAASKMASLLGGRVVTKDEVDEDPFSFEGCVVVTPSRDASIAGSCLSSTVEAAENPYGASEVRCCYQFEIDDDYSPDERTYFAPTENSVAKPGDRMFMVVFHGNIPGGWTMVDQGLSVTEYWQLGGEDLSDEVSDDRAT